ncbi:MAG: SocA family protein [Alphaproteobacteria bacterium]|nr:SocA family protein [Alphaproteobacteria bacterium]
MTRPAETERPSGPRLNFKPKVDKILELLVYLAHKRPNADQYQAVKLFYLADREHLNRFGRPITFDLYYALDYGPVASTALDLIKGRRPALRKAKIEQLPIKIEKRAHILILAEPKRSVNYDLFSKSDIEVFDKTIDRYGNCNFDALYKLTHSHFAYDAAWKSRTKGESRALMYYEDMLEEGAIKASILEDIEPVAERLK